MGFEPWLERDHLIALDFEPIVVGCPVNRSGCSDTTLSAIRKAAIDAVLGGTETITKAVLDQVRLDHAAGTHALRSRIGPHCGKAAGDVA